MRERFREKRCMIIRNRLYLRRNKHRPHHERNKHGACAEVPCRDTGL
jgi:hypothetical protein